MFRDEGWRGARKPASLGEGVNPFSARCLIIPPASLPGPVLRPELVDDGFLLLGEPGAGQDQFNRRIRFTPFSKHFPFRLTERARSVQASAADKESRGLALWRGAWGGGSPSGKAGQARRVLLTFVNALLALACLFHDVELQPKRAVICLRLH